MGRPELLERAEFAEMAVRARHMDALDEEVVNDPHLHERGTLEAGGAI